MSSISEGDGMLKDGCIAPANTPIYSRDYCRSPSPYTPEYNNPNPDPKDCYNPCEHNEVFYDNSKLDNLVDIAITRKEITMSHLIDWSKYRLVKYIEYLQKTNEELVEDKQDLNKDVRKKDMELRELSDKFYEILRQNKALEEKLQHHKEITLRQQQYNPQYPYPTTIIRSEMVYPSYMETPYKLKSSNTTGKYQSNIRSMMKGSKEKNTPYKKKK